MPFSSHFQKISVYICGNKINWTQSFDTYWHSSTGHSSSENHKANCLSNHVFLREKSALAFSEVCRVENMIREPSYLFSGIIQQEFLTFKSIKSHQYPTQSIESIPVRMLVLFMGRGPDIPQ